MDSASVRAWDLQARMAAPSTVHHCRADWSQQAQRRGAANDNLNSQIDDLMPPGAISGLPNSRPLPENTEYGHSACAAVRPALVAIRRSGTHDPFISNPLKPRKGIFSPLVRIVSPSKMQLTRLLRVRPMYATQLPPDALGERSPNLRPLHR